jgi:SLT domain-containing protein
MTSFDVPIPGHGQDITIEAPEGYEIEAEIRRQPGGPVNAPATGPRAGGFDELEAIVTACRAEGVDPAIWLQPLRILIGRESGGQVTGYWEPSVTQHGYVDVNTGGNEAVGVAQVTPSTAAGVGIDPRTLTDPVSNIRASIRYIKSRYAGPDAPSRGEGGLGKKLAAEQAILNVQQADPTMPPHGYRRGGRVGPFV